MYRQMRNHTALRLLLSVLLIIAQGSMGMAAYASDMPTDAVTVPSVEETGAPPPADPAPADTTAPATDAPAPATDVPTSEPAATSMPTNFSTPTPAVTDGLFSTPTPAVTAVPTDVPTAIPTEAPTATPVASTEPPATASPEVTASPSPEATPIPSDAAGPWARTDDAPMDVREVLAEMGISPASIIDHLSVEFDEDGQAVTTPTESAQIALTLHLLLPEGLPQQLRPEDWYELPLPDTLLPAATDVRGCGIRAG